MADMGEQGATVMASPPPSRFYSLTLKSTLAAVTEVEGAMGSEEVKGVTAAMAEKGTDLRVARLAVRVGLEALEEMAGTVVQEEGAD
jgi:hypothetical protein